MKKKILLIEDDKIDQMAFKRKLDDEKIYEYDVAGSVIEAKQMLSKNRYDLVLVDFSLGDGTGFDVFNAIGETPYIVVTGENSADIAVEAIKAGASDYLVKDLNRAYLTLLPTVIERTIEEHKLSERVSMLSEAMGNISDSVYITVPDGEIVYVNGAFTRTYGYREDEAIGRKISDLTGEEKAEDLRHRRKDGSRFPVELSSSTINTERGTVNYRVTVVHDLTERKKMEDALQQAIEKFSLLLDLQGRQNAA